MREHPYECIETNENGWSYLSKPDHRTEGRQDYNENFFFIDGSFYFSITRMGKMDTLYCVFVPNGIKYMAVFKAISSIF